MNATENNQTEFPMDWNEWRRQWMEFRGKHFAEFRGTKERFPDKNFMADEILGTWLINGEVTELSEVTFLDQRGVGITRRDTEGNFTGGVVHSFSELEEALGI